MNPPLAIGIDLGGTNIRAALVDGEGRILHRLEQPTGASRGSDLVIDELADIIRRLSITSGSQVEDRGEGQHLPLPPGEGRGEGPIQKRIIGIGLATPGPLDFQGGRIIHAANLPGWKDVRIRDVLREKTGLPVTLENDGNAAAYGEYCFGAGRGRDDLVMLTLGTGVGSGVVLNGRILHGHFDNAAELGHMIVVVEGLPCPCGQRGCLEQYASADAIVRRVLSADPNRERKRSDPPLRSEDVAEAAAAGDALCERVWEEACIYLAIACVTIQHAFNPAKIVLGGGLSNSGAQLLDRVNAHFRKQVWSLHNDAPEIVVTRLGADAGLIGAAILAIPRVP